MVNIKMGLRLMFASFLAYFDYTQLKKNINLEVILRYWLTFPLNSKVKIYVNIKIVTILMFIKEFAILLHALYHKSRPKQSMEWPSTVTA